MSTLTLYGSSICPLSQSVHMTLDLLKLQYTYIEVKIHEGGLSSHEFLALNPHKSVPVLVDSSLIITESSAIITYLVNQYNPSQLYPQCAKKRSQIDQRLQFNIGKFHKRFEDCVLPVCLNKAVTVDREKLNALKEVLMWLNQMTAGGYVLDNSMTIADLAFLSNMCTLEACDFVDMSAFINIRLWLEKMKKQVPNFENNCQKGANKFGKWFQERYKKKPSDEGVRNIMKDESKEEETSSTADTISTMIGSDGSSSEYESSTDYTFSASEDGSYTNTEQALQDEEQTLGHMKGGAALARQVMMIMTPVLGNLPLNIRE